MKRYRIIALLVCAALLLSGCTGQVPASDTEPTITLPPASIDSAAPVGEAALEYTAQATLYLPRYDSTLLGAYQTEVTFSAARPDSESLVRALLAQPDTGTLSSLGGGVKLALYGINPVEQSRNVVTVNLAASALQMDRKALYIACQAITNTLTELPSVDYVNFLVVDRAIGLDIANTLPMGAFSRSVGVDIGAAYDQLLLRRVDVTESAAKKPLSSEVTLYLPLAGTPGVLSEVRSCSFSNQLTGDMVVVLLQELSEGSQQTAQIPALPLLADLLTEKPMVEETEESGMLIKLDFAYNLDEMLAANHISRSSCMASLCYTLCTYFPGISGIRVSVGDMPIETLMLTDQIESSVSFTNQVMSRSDFSLLLYDLCKLYLPDSGTGRLVSVERPVPYYHAKHPRMLLKELSKGPQAFDSHPGTLPVMEQDSLTDTSVIGLALTEDVLQVNLSEGFTDAFQADDSEAERLLAYALTNTLCFNTGRECVQFFVAGKLFEGFTGEIYWQSSFSPMY